MVCLYFCHFAQNHVNSTTSTPAYDSQLVGALNQSEIDDDTPLCEMLYSRIVSSVERIYNSREYCNLTCDFMGQMSAIAAGI